MSRAAGRFDLPAVWLASLAAAALLLLPWAAPLKALAEPLRAARPGFLPPLALACLEGGAAALLWALAGWGLGRPLLRRLGAAPEADPASAFALGLAALSAAMLALCAAGLLRAWTAGAALAAGALAGLLRPPPRPALPRSPAAWAAGAALGAAFLASLSPPTFYDALVYHLALPEAYARAGGFVRAPFLSHAGFPEGWDLLYAYGAALGWERLSTSLPAAALAAAAALAWRRSPAGALLLLAAPAALRSGAVCGTEAGWLLFHLAAALQLAAHAERPDRLGPLRVAAFAGAALVCKPPALEGALALGAGLLWVEARRRPASEAARTLALFAAVQLAFSAPWLARNLAERGNPLFPFAPGSESWTRLMSDAHPLFGAGSPALELLRRPWLAFTGAEDQHFLGLVPLALLPFALRPGAAPGRRALLVVFWTGWALWAASSDRGRFFLPHLAVLAAAAGEGLTLTRARTAALLALALLHLARGAAKLEAPGGWQVAVGELSADAYLAEPHLGYPTPSRAVLRSLEGAGAVLLVGETRAYGSPVPALWGSELDVQPLARLAREARDGEELFRRLQALEVRWLLVDLPEAARLPAHAFPWDAASWAVFDGFWRAHVVELPPGEGPVRLYGLTARRRGPVPDLPFMPMAARVPGTAAE